MLFDIFNTIHVVLVQWLLFKNTIWPLSVDEDEMLLTILNFEKRSVYHIKHITYQFSKSDLIIVVESGEWIISFFRVRDCTLISVITTGRQLFANSSACMVFRPDSHLYQEEPDMFTWFWTRDSAWYLRCRLQAGRHKSAFYYVL